MATATKQEVPELSHMQELLFEAPLYAVFEQPGRKLNKDTDLEAFCTECGKENVFKTEWRPDFSHWGTTPHVAYVNVTCRCVRGTGTHVAHFSFGLKPTPSGKSASFRHMLPWKTVERNNCENYWIRRALPNCIGRSD